MGWEQAFINRHRVARLATVSAAGQPHVIPIVYAFASEKLYTPVDAKPKRVAMRKLQRVRNIEANEWVAVVIDEYSEAWTQLAWVQIRGIARVADEGPERDTGLELLRQKYSQYQAMPLANSLIVVITVRHMTSWRARDFEEGKS